MDPLANERSQLVQAFVDGLTVTPEQVSRFPDLILAPDVDVLPAWLLPLIRRPVARGAARYVVANGEPFHVSRGDAGEIVCRVEYFVNGGTRKPIHNIASVTQDDRQIALAAFQTVSMFLAEPMTFRDLIAAGKSPHFTPSSAGTVRVESRPPVAVSEAMSQAAIASGLHDGTAPAEPQAVPDSFVHVSHKPRRRVTAAF